MTRKPTYAELENRLLELEKKDSERKLVEASLRESDEILRLFVKNTPAAVAMCDRQMRYVAYSDRWVHDYGLVPICASCKKIRDDKGYWNQIESYISKHTEATFSHGICPVCQDKMYGEEDWYKRRYKK